MIKEVLIALIKDRLAGGDAPASIRSKYDPRIIERTLEIVYNDMIWQVYERGREVSDFSGLDPFGTSYKVVVGYDSDRDEYYVELPVNSVPLPDNRAFRLVAPYKNQTAAFDYIDNNSQHVFNTLFNNIVRQVGKFYAEGNRLYVSNFPTAEVTTLMVKMIIPFDALSNTDDVFIPGGNNTAMFQAVSDIMLSKNQTPKLDYDNASSKQI